MALTWSHTAHPAYVDVDTANPYTFTGVDIGTASADRVVVVSLNSRQRTVSGVKIATIDATLVAVDSAAARNVSMWYAAVPTGTTADIEITCALAYNWLGILVGILKGATAAPTDTDAVPWQYSSPASPDCNVPSGGIMLWALGCESGTLSASVNQGVIDYTIHGTTDCDLAAGYLSGVSGEQTVEISGGAVGCGAVAGAWEPASGERKWLLARPT